MKKEWDVSNLSYDEKENKWMPVKTFIVDAPETAFYDFDPDFYGNAIYPIYGCDEYLEPINTMSYSYVSSISDLPIKDISKENVFGEPVAIYLTKYMNDNTISVMAIYEKK